MPSDAEQSGRFLRFYHVFRQGELEALATEAVSSYADMGLRLYPVPSDAYEQYEDRTEYSLRLDLDGFHVLVSEKLVENPASQTKSIRKQLDRVVCRSKAVFTKRRAGRPPLRVGAGVGHASTNATTPSTVLESAIPVRASIDDGYGLTVNSTNVTSVIKDATLEALSNLTPAMDREISLL